MDLAHPFKWNAKLSFLLPEYLLDQLHSPTPFFFGLLNEHLSRCRRLKGIVYVDLDHDHIHSGRSLPHFPRAGFNQLAQLLRRARAALSLPMHPADIFNDPHAVATGTVQSVEALQAARVRGILEGDEDAAAAARQTNQSRIIQRLRSLQPNRRLLHTIRISFENYFVKALASVSDFIERVDPTVSRVGTGFSRPGSSQHQLVPLGSPVLVDEHCFVFDAGAFLATHPDYLFRQVFDTIMFDKMSLELSAAIGNKSLLGNQNSLRTSQHGFAFGHPSAAESGLIDDNLLSLCTNPTMRYLLTIQNPCGVVPVSVACRHCHASSGLCREGGCSARTQPHPPPQ